jgi:hypothetical protein
LVEEYKSKVKEARDNRKERLVEEYMSKVKELKEYLSKPDDDLNREKIVSLLFLLGSMTKPSVSSSYQSVRDCLSFRTFCSSDKMVQELKRLYQERERDRPSATFSEDRRLEDAKVNELFMRKDPNKIISDLGEHFKCPAIRSSIYYYPYHGDTTHPNMREYLINHIPPHIVRDIIDEMFRQLEDIHNSPSTIYKILIHPEEQEW